MNLFLSTLALMVGCSMAKPPDIFIYEDIEEPAQRYTRGFKDEAVITSNGEDIPEPSEAVIKTKAPTTMFAESDLPTYSYTPDTANSVKKPNVHNGAGQGGTHELGGSHTHTGRSNQGGFNPGKTSDSNQGGFNPGNSGSSNQGGFNPGKTEDPTQGGFNPGKTGDSNQGGFNPVNSESSNQGGFNPGKTGDSGNGGFNPGNSGNSNHGGFNPGKTGDSNHGGFNPGNSESSNQGGFNPGKTGDSGHGGFNPGNSGNSNHGGFNPGKTGDSNVVFPKTRKSTLNLPSRNLPSITNTSMAVSELENLVEKLVHKNLKNLVIDGIFEGRLTIESNSQDVQIDNDDEERPSFQPFGIFDLIPSRLKPFRRIQQKSSFRGAPVTNSFHQNAIRDTFIKENSQQAQSPPSLIQVHPSIFVYTPPKQTKPFGQLPAVDPNPSSLNSQKQTKPFGQVDINQISMGHVPSTFFYPKKQTKPFGTDSEVLPQEDPIIFFFNPQKQTKPSRFQGAQTLPSPISFNRETHTQLFGQEVAAVDPIPSDFIPRRQTKPFGIDPVVLHQKQTKPVGQEVEVDPVPSSFNPQKQTSPFRHQGVQTLPSPISFNQETHTKPIDQGVAVDPIPSAFIPRRQTKPFGIDPVVLHQKQTKPLGPEVAVDPIPSSFIPRRQTKPFGIDQVVLHQKQTNLFGQEVAVDPIPIFLNAHQLTKPFGQEAAVDPIPSAFIPRRQTKPFGIEPVVLHKKQTKPFGQKVEVDPIPSSFNPQKQTSPFGHQGAQTLPSPISFNRETNSKPFDQVEVDPIPSAFIPRRQTKPFGIDPVVLHQLQTKHQEVAVDPIHSSFNPQEEAKPFEINPVVFPGQVNPSIFFFNPQEVEVGPVPSAFIPQRQTKPFGIDPVVLHQKQTKPFGEEVAVDPIPGFLNVQQQTKQLGQSPVTFPGHVQFDPSLFFLNAKAQTSPFSPITAAETLPFQFNQNNRDIIVELPASTLATPLEFTDGTNTIQVDQNSPGKVFYRLVQLNPGVSPGYSVPLSGAHTKPRPVAPRPYDAAREYLRSAGLESLDQSRSTVIVFN